MLASIAVYGDRFPGGIDSSLSLTMARSARRGPWLPEEDEALLQLVRTQGASNWVRISQQLQHRSPKQCRERYHQNLKPSLKHDPITAQEGEVIERLVQEMGKRWAEIARRLGNRSDNAVKNWWNGSVNRRRRNPAQTTTGLKQVGSRLQPIPFSLPAQPNHASQSRSNRSIQIHGNSQSFDAQHDRSQSPKPHNLPNSNSLLASGATKTWQSFRTSASRPPNAPFNTLEARPELPPVRSSPYYIPYNGRMCSTVEPSPISPALSDISQQQPPSLISDSQSMPSISPKTVTTPRPGLSAPAERVSSAGPDAHLTTQHCHPLAPNKRKTQIEMFSRAVNNVTLGSVHQKCPDSTMIDGKPKDSRMHVSTLLQ